MTVGVYTITHRESGNCYVGQSCDMPRRWSEHRKMLRNNKHHSKYLQRAWAKYGENSFDFQVAETCDLDDLTEREQWWMDKLLPVFNTAPAAGSTRGLVPSAETRANLRAINTGKKHSPEARVRISESMKAHLAEFPRVPMSSETRTKISATKKGTIPTPELLTRLHEGNRGRKHTDETKANMSAAQKGRTCTPEQRAKISATLTGRKLSPERCAAMCIGQARRRALEAEQAKLPHTNEI